MPSMVVPPNEQQSIRRLQVQSRTYAALGAVGVAASGVLLYPKIILIATGDPGVIGVGLVANLALAFGSLMFLRNARLYRLRAAALLRPGEHP